MSYILEVLKYVAAFASSPNALFAIHNFSKFTVQTAAIGT
jgi:hypothetical protein